MEYETIIGLETHVQLKTDSKMFCRCSADYTGAKPNSHVCNVCLGAPGVLPTINEKAVRFTIMTALALSSKISSFTKFDRKNYFYPDLMKDYQISQYDAPVGLGGCLEVETNGQARRIGITRVHLEEDTAKLLHREGGGESYSLIDVNRSGVPLMEIVSEPDIRSAEEARQYLMKLRSILRYLGVSNANMEEGSFRCDANISIRPVGEEKLLTKTEVKNMNSFKAVFKALQYEEKRQRKVTCEGGELVQETRGWVEDKAITISQRSKEDAHDYRYLPEPDLPPLTVSAEWITEIEKELPELPTAKKERFIKEYNLPAYDAALLTASKEMAEYFEQTAKAVKGTKPKEISNWLLGAVSGIINTVGCDITAFNNKVNPANLAGLITKTLKGEVGATAAKMALEEMFATGKNAAAIIVDKGLSQISDSGEIETVARQIVTENSRAVADYKAGKDQAVKFMVGQMMRATKGRVNPQIATQMIMQMLEEGLE